MKQLLRLPSTYLGLPILFACGMTLLTYDLPAGYLDGVLLLAAAGLGTMLLDLLLGMRLPPQTDFRQCRCAGTRQGFAGLAFAGLVVLFCLLDVALFPIPLFNNPSSYATLESGREHVRHISDMCWTLPVIGLLCTRSRALRYALIAIGVLFPVLVIDRNRIFASLFSAALVVVLRRDESRPLPWKTIVAVALGGAVAFSVLGMLRSGSLDTVALPFGALYRAAPQGVKWLLLYISAGPYNFGAMLAKHYVNASFLVNQLVPLQGSIATAGTGIPLDAPNINVGTEFFPFLLAFGTVGALAALLTLYVMLLWSVRLLRRQVSLFALLIFLRMAYVCLMSPFAPQAFTWMSFGFLGLCLVMQLLAAWLPNRRVSAPRTPLLPLAP